MNLDKFRNAPDGVDDELVPPFPLAGASMASSSPFDQLLAQAEHLSDEERIFVQQALRGVPVEANDAFPPEVNARLAVAEEHARNSIVSVPRTFKTWAPVPRASA